MNTVNTSGGGGGGGNIIMHPIPIPTGLGRFGHFKMGLRGGSPMYTLGKGAKRLPSAAASSAAAASTSATAKKPDSEQTASAATPAKPTSNVVTSLVDQDYNAFDDGSNGSNVSNGSSSNGSRKTKGKTQPPAATAAASTPAASSKSQQQQRHTDYEYDNDKTVVVGSEVSLSSVAQPHLHDADDMAMMYGSTSAASATGDNVDDFGIATSPLDEVVEDYQLFPCVSDFVLDSDDASVRPTPKNSGADDAKSAAKSPAVAENDEAAMMDAEAAQAGFAVDEEDDDDDDDEDFMNTEVVILEEPIGSDSTCEAAAPPTVVLKPAPTPPILEDVDMCEAPAKVVKLTKPASVVVIANKPLASSSSSSTIIVTTASPSNVLVKERKLISVMVSQPNVSGGHTTTTTAALKTSQVVTYGRMPITGATIMQSKGGMPIYATTSAAHKKMVKDATQTTAKVSIGNTTISVPVLKNIPQQQQHQQQAGASTSQQQQQQPRKVLSQPLSLSLSKGTATTLTKLNPGAMVTLASIGRSPGTVGASARFVQATLVRPGGQMQQQSTPSASPTGPSLQQKRQLLEQLASSGGGIRTVTQLGYSKLSSLKVTQDVRLPTKIFEDESISPDSSLEHDGLELSDSNQTTLEVVAGSTQQVSVAMPMADEAGDKMDVDELMSDDWKLEGSEKSSDGCLQDKPTSATKPVHVVIKSRESSSSPKLPSTSTVATSTSQVPQLSPLSQPTEIQSNMANASQQLMSIMSSLNQPAATQVVTAATPAMTVTTSLVVKKDGQQQQQPAKVSSEAQPTTTVAQNMSAFVNKAPISTTASKIIVVKHPAFGGTSRSSPPNADGGVKVTIKQVAAPKPAKSPPTTMQQPSTTTTDTANKPPPPVTVSILGTTLAQPINTNAAVSAAQSRPASGLNYPDRSVFSMSMTSASSTQAIQNILQSSLHSRPLSGSILGSTLSQPSTKSTAAAAAAAMPSPSSNTLLHTQLTAPMTAANNTAAAAAAAVAAFRRSKSIDEVPAVRETPAAIMGMKRHSMEVSTAKDEPMDTTAASEPMVVPKPTSIVQQESPTVQAVAPPKAEDSQNVLLKQLLQNSTSTAPNNSSNCSSNNSPASGPTPGPVAVQQQQSGSVSMSSRPVPNIRAPSLGVVSSLEAQLARPVIPPVPARSTMQAASSSVSLTTAVAGQQPQSQQQHQHQQHQNNDPSKQQRPHHHHVMSRETSFVSKPVAAGGAATPAASSTSSQPNSTSMSELRKNWAQSLGQPNKRDESRPNVVAVSTASTPTASTPPGASIVVSAPAPTIKPLEPPPAYAVATAQVKQTQPQPQPQTTTDNVQPSASPVPPGTPKMEPPASAESPPVVAVRTPTPNSSSAPFPNTNSSNTSTPTTPNAPHPVTPSGGPPSMPASIAAADIKREYLDDSSQLSAASDHSSIRHDGSNAATGGGVTPLSTPIKDEPMLPLDEEAAAKAAQELALELKRKKRREYQKNRRQMQTQSKESGGGNAAAGTNASATTAGGAGSAGGSGPTTPSTTGGNSGGGGGSTKKKARKSAKVDEDYDTFIENLMCQLRAMPAMQILEPQLSRNYGICPAFGTGDPAKFGAAGAPPIDSSAAMTPPATAGGAGSELRGLFGQAELPGVADFYNTSPFGCKSPLAEPANTSTHYGFYDQEFSPIRFDTDTDGTSGGIGGGAGDLLFPAAARYGSKFDASRERDLETPDSIISSSSPECVQWDPQPQHFPGLRLIREESDEELEAGSDTGRSSHTQRRRMSPTIPIVAPIPIRLKPGMSLATAAASTAGSLQGANAAAAAATHAALVQQQHTHNKENEGDRRAASTVDLLGAASKSRFGPPTPLKDKSNVTVTLTLSSSAAEDILGVLRDLANILHIPAPTAYQIVERTTTPPSQKLGLYRTRGKDGKEGAPIDIQTILNGAAKFCRHCDVVILNTIIRAKASEFPLLDASEAGAGNGTASAAGNDLLTDTDDLYFCSRACYKQFQWRPTSILLDDKSMVNSNAFGDCGTSATTIETLDTNVLLTNATPTTDVDLLDDDLKMDIDLCESDLKEVGICINELDIKQEIKEELLDNSMDDSMGSELITDGSGRPASSTSAVGGGVRHKGTRYKRYVPGCFRSPIKQRPLNMTNMLLGLKITVTPDPMPDDSRLCVLCKQVGDSVTDGPSRLLNYDADKWVHLNCALWSDGVYETVNGALMNVDAALRLQNACTHCHHLGATIKCFKFSCENVYHLGCAKKDDCKFYKNKTIYCAQHTLRKEKHNELTTLSVQRRVYVERDESAQVAAVMHQSAEASHLLRVGSLIFMSVGQLLPHQLQKFHTENYIYPIGYQIVSICRLL